MRINLRQRFISLFLAFVLVFQLVPMQALATGSSSGEDVLSPSGPPAELEEGNEDTAPLTVWGEMDGLRTEGEKQFRLSDGSYIAVDYGMPVHYENGEGQWEDIDNSLKPVAAGAQAAMYSAVDNDHTTSFAATLQNGLLFRTERDGYGVAMSLLDEAQAELLAAGTPEDMPGAETVPAETVAIPDEEETVPTIPVTEPTETTEPEIVPTEPETAPAEVETTPTTEVIPEETGISETLPDIAEPEVPGDNEEPAESEENTEPFATQENSEPQQNGETIPETTEKINAVSGDATEPAVTEETVPNISETTQPTEAETVPEEETEVTEPLEIAVSTEPTEEETTEETIPQEGLVYNRTAQAYLDTPDSMPFALAEEQKSLVEQLIPENLSSAVLYPEVFPGVDFRYNICGYNIKESIIVNEPLDSYRFSFHLELDGLTPILQEDGSIQLVNTSGEAAYEIPAPYMEDSAYATSSAATYALTELADGYLLMVEADKEWMESSDREYPITIDPTLAVPVKGNTGNTFTTFVKQGSPTAVPGASQGLYLGYSSLSSSKENQIYMHFNQLPTLPKGSVVVNATLNLFLYDYTEINCPEMGVGLYGVTEEKPADKTYKQWIEGICWNTKPDFDTGNMIDFTFASKALDNTYLTWDMTELVNNWYTTQSGKHTIALAATPEKTYSSSCCAVPVFDSFKYNSPPILTVTYRNNTGLEPYYTYKTMDAGNAGTAYISDYSSQLTIVKDLVSYNSTIHPFNLQFIFNSSYFSESLSTQYDLCADLGMAMHLGSGCQLNVTQYVKEEIIDGQKYIRYLDGDGTIHYFAKDSSRDANYYYDEDGLGLKITEYADGYYRMTDDKNNQLVFANGPLIWIVDSDENRIEMHYSKNGAAVGNDYSTGSNDRLEYIALKPYGQPAITIATFKYKSHSPSGTALPNYLDTITDYAGNYYTFNYQNGKMTSLSYNGTEIAKYNMRYNNGWYINLMDSAVDVESGYALNFSYAQRKVSGVQETVGSTTGAKVEITQTPDRQTIYRDLGADRTAKTADDILTYYSFDYAGRTVNAYTTDNKGNILGASNAAYSGNGTTDKTNNRTLRTASIGVAGQQAMRNGGFEHNNSGLTWTFGGTGTDATLAVATTLPRTGSNSLKGYIASGKTATTSASKDSDSLTSGKAYAFSAYVNTSQLTGFGGKGIYLQVKDASGNTWKSEAVNYKTNTLVDGGWVRLSVNFTAKVSGAHTVSLYNDNAKGTFYADDFQLEQGSAPSGVNLLDNGSLNSDTAGWNMNPGASYATTSGFPSGDTRGIQIKGSPREVNGNAWQDVTIKLPATQTFVLSGWVKANAVPDNAQTASTPEWDQNKQLVSRAIVYYTDVNCESFYVPFNPDLPGWQYVSLTIVPKHPELTIQKIKILCAYEKNANTAVFDNLSLVREVAQTMTYDADGNLKSVTSTGLKEDANTYSGGNLIKTVTGGNGTYTYTYGTGRTAHRLVTVSNGKVKETLGYDTYGNVTATTLQAADGTGKYIRTSATFTGTGNQVASITDSTGQWVSYAYGSSLNQMLGLPSTTTDAKGVAVTSVYDNRGRITQNTLANTVNLSYNYTKGMLNYVERTAKTNAQRYNFAYDAFGNRTSIKVGNTLLAQYAYAASNGNLTKQTYGNGDSVSFTYDNLNRVTKATYSNGRVLTYTYTGDGQLFSMKDDMGTSAASDDITYLYTYDSLGRLIVSEEKRGGTSALRTAQQYDNVGRLSGQSWQMGNTAYSESYTYNTTDGSLATMKTAAGKTLSYTYDTLQRLSSVAAGVYTRKYIYRDIDTTRTTPQVQKVSYSGLQNARSYAYLYDVCGRITRVTEASGDYTAFAYDSQGQLLFATDYTSGGVAKQRYKYTYDGAGNILTAAVTSGDNSTTYQSHTYTYGDANWKDLLTAYDGQSITYSGGNPTSYYNGTRWTFGWAEGRKLTTATKSGTTLGFTYNGDGVRTSKTVNGTVHNYYYAGGKLLRETYGSNTLDFCYDSMGRPFALTYNGTTYYYVTNLQGDVVRIVNASGTSVADYTYDPWGKVLTATGTLANVNPLKYRGYYHDTETGFYYLQSRYYDPAICRFINADAFASTGQGFVGYNMFAYCGNNPVNLTDSAGHLPKWIQNCIDAAKDAYSYVCNAVGDIYSDLERINFNPFNSDERAVLAAQYISFYKGQFVIRGDWEIFGNRSGSFIIMFLDRNEQEEEIVETVRHEHGHFRQLGLLGVPTFFWNYAIPSILSGEVPTEDYYSLPWERTADSLGGVDREGYAYATGSDIVADIYLTMNIISVLFG